MNSSRMPVIGAIGSLLVLATTLLAACAPDVATAAVAVTALAASSVSDNAVSVGHAAQMSGKVLSQATALLTASARLA